MTYLRKILGASSIQRRCNEDIGVITGKTQGTAQSTAMATGQFSGSGDAKVDLETMYGLTWANPKFLPHMITTQSVLDYFCDRSNPFYDRECNNEVLRMQRLSLEQLRTMSGIEYCLHNAREPILYVIRKQERQSANQVKHLAFYYVINGIVHQSPDVAALVNSRLLTAVYHLNTSFQEIMSFARYHPANGTYSWELNSFGFQKKSAGENTSGSREDLTGDSSQTGTAFQRQRVDPLITEIMRRFPAPDISQHLAVATSTGHVSPSGQQLAQPVQPETESGMDVDGQRDSSTASVNGQSSSSCPPDKKPRLS